MKEKDTKFIITWKDSFSYNRLGEYLNTFSDTDTNETSFLIGTVRVNGFYIEHQTITKIKKQFPDWEERFEFYSKKGDGKERLYCIPTRKKCADEKINLSQLAVILRRKEK
jgi:hypothetical protein